MHMPVFARARVVPFESGNSRRTLKRRGLLYQKQNGVSTILFQERGDNACIWRGLLRSATGVDCVCAIQSRWRGEPFSPGGPRNYRLCFKVDCVPIMYARGGERRRGITAGGGREKDDYALDPDGAREGRWIREGGRERERRGETPLKYGPSNWLRHIEFGSMGSRAHGLLELRHVIRRSVVRSWKELPASVTSLRGFYVSKIQAAQEGISPGWLPPSGATQKPAASIRLINRTPLRTWKYISGKINYGARRE